VVAGVTILGSGIIIFRSEPSPTKVSVWATAAFFFTAAVYVANIFITCSNVKITTESKNRSEATVRNPA
jgi:uncharacterized membrane protein YhiD involved in acid resistance